MQKVLGFIEFWHESKDGQDLNQSSNLSLTLKLGSSLTLGLSNLIG
jgi:hypothetical protein